MSDNVTQMPLTRDAEMHLVRTAAESTIEHLRIATGERPAVAMTALALMAALAFKSAGASRDEFLDQISDMFDALPENGGDND